MNINGKEILRVFPRRTKATPDDPLALIVATKVGEIWKEDIQ